MTKGELARGMSSQRRRRDSARVILLDSDGRVLLRRAEDPHDPKPPLWITPGGGAQAGEDLAHAAARELAEETGLRLRVSELGEPVAVCRGDWEFRGGLAPSTGEDRGPPTLWNCRGKRCEPEALNGISRRSRGLP